MQKKLTALKAKKAQDAAHAEREKDHFSGEEELTQIRGTVKSTKGKYLWFNFNLAFEAATKEFTLTVKHHGKSGDYLAKR